MVFTGFLVRNIESFSPNGALIFPLTVDCWDGNSGLIASVETGSATRAPLIDIATGKTIDLPATTFFAPGLDPARRCSTCMSRSRVGFAPGLVRRDNGDVPVYSHSRKRPIVESFFRASQDGGRVYTRGPKMSLRITGGSNNPRWLG